MCAPQSFAGGRYEGESVRSLDRSDLYGSRRSLNYWLHWVELEKAFSICRTGNTWRLRMQNTDTEGTFGTLGAAMRCAYLLADGLQDWKTDSDGGAVGSL